MIRKIAKQFLSRQFIKYVIVGLLATVLDFSLTYSLVELGHLHYLFAAIISISIVIWISFSINKYWTFRNVEKQYFQQFIKYILSHAIALAVNLLVLAILVQFCHLWYIYAKCFATVAAAITNFLLVKKYIF